MDSEIRLTIAPIEQIAVAMTNAQLGVQQMLARFQANFDEVAAIVRVFTANQQLLVEQWMLQDQLTWARMAETMAVATASFERYRSEEEPEACKLLSQAGWLGMDRHFCITQLRESVLLYKMHGEMAMNDAIRDYFNEDDSALLVHMSESWMSIPYLRDREKIIRDAVYAHKNGLFTLSIPALLPLVEGLSAEVLGTSTKKAVALLAEDRRAHDPEVWVQGFCDFVAQVFYRGYQFGKDSAPYLNRHGILHGRDFTYPSALNSTRVFLLIDTIADLWRQKQRALAPATIQ